MFGSFKTVNASIKIKNNNMMTLNNTSNKRKTVMANQQLPQYDIDNHHDNDTLNNNHQLLLDDDDTSVVEKWDGLQDFFFSDNLCHHDVPSPRSSPTAAPTVGDNPHGSTTTTSGEEALGEIFPKTTLTDNNDGPRSTTTKKMLRSMAFPSRLHTLLQEASDSGLDHIVSWRLDGHAFKVVDQKAFTKLFLPEYFDQTHYKSFQRQLNMYDFARIKWGADKGSYVHEHFVRDKPDMCKLMQRRKRNDTAKSRRENLLRASLLQSSPATPTTTEGGRPDVEPKSDDLIVLGDNEQAPPTTSANNHDVLCASDLLGHSFDSPVPSGQNHQNVLVALEAGHPRDDDNEPLPLFPLAAPQHYQHEEQTFFFETRNEMNHNNIINPTNNYKGANDDSLTPNKVVYGIQAKSSVLSEKFYKSLSEDMINDIVDIFR